MVLPPSSPFMAPLPPSKLFEFLVAIILRRNGFLANVPAKFVSGRAASHQIDVVGLYQLAIPFVFPVMLIVEAKCYSKRTVGIPIVRNLAGTLKDLEQTLPSRHAQPMGIDDIQASCTHRGAIFSTVSFSPEAAQYAYGHGIFLVPFNGKPGSRSLLDWIKRIEQELLWASEGVGHDHLD